jgi:hypothetical protein
VDAADQEDLVVHRQAEDDREHDHRQAGEDRAAGDPEQGAEPAVLEDGDDDSQRGADREQVHDRGLQRDDQRAEHDHQQHGGEQHDDADEVRQPVGERAREVDICRGRSADEGGRAGLPLDRRDDVAAQVVDQIRGL